MKESTQCSLVDQVDLWNEKMKEWMNERGDRYSPDDVIARTDPSFLDMWSQRAERDGFAYFFISLLSLLPYSSSVYYISCFGQPARTIYKLSWKSHNYISSTTIRYDFMSCPNPHSTLGWTRWMQESGTERADWYGQVKSKWALLLPTLGLVPPRYFTASFVRMKHHKPSHLRMWWAPHLIHWFTLMNMTGACLYTSPTSPSFFSSYTFLPSW